MKTTPTLLRTPVEMTTDAKGRTLLGIAARWNTPYVVADAVDLPSHGMSRAPHREALAPTSVDGTLAQRPAPRPLFKSHGHLVGDDPIGTVEFRRTDAGLLFVARISRTRDGDDALTLVNDGAMESVSVGMIPVRHKVAGDVVVRTEVMLKELSLAPTGFGQYGDDARVHSVRTSETLAELEARSKAKDRRVDAALALYDDTERYLAGALTRSEFVRRHPTSKFAAVLQRHC